MLFRALSVLTFMFFFPVFPPTETQSCNLFMLSADLKQTIDADGKYGWKHGLMREDLAPDDFMVFVTRDVKTWTNRMRLRTYSA